MNIYVNLRLFRLEHDQMHQTELAQILGIKQSSLSRIEKMHKDLDEFQYKRLVEHFGEEDVKQYVSANPLQNVANKRIRQKESSKPQAEVATLTEVIKSQQEEISRLNARIAELTDLFIAQHYPEKQKEIMDVLNQ